MKDDIIRKIIYEMGIDINENNELVDQDFRNTIMINGKCLKYNLDPNVRVRVNNETEMYFNPIGNRNIAKDLLYIYLHKLETLDGRYFHTVFSAYGPNRTTGIVAKGQNEVIESMYYSNINLAYIEVILRLGGNAIDLRYLDN